MRLINTCEQGGLRIANGFFPHKWIHKYTWEARGQKSIIDYAIVRQNTKLKVQDVRVCRGVTCGSDHYCVKMALFFPNHAQTSTDAKIEESMETFEINSPAYNLESLLNESTVQLYKRRLKGKLAQQSFNSLEEHYEYVK